jgi:uncharacterized protein YciI
MADDWYVVHARFVGDPDQQTQLRDEHLRYVAELMDEGLLAAGPLEGSGERLRIMRARSREAAQAALERDPWHRAGLLDARVLRWTLGARARSRLDAGLAIEAAITTTEAD